MESTPYNVFQLFRASSETKKTTGITDIPNKNEFHSYQDVYEKAVKMASQLHEQLQKGSRVGLFIESSIERVILVLALLKRGIVIVPINLSSSKDVIQHIVTEAHLEGVFVSRKYEEVWKNHSINVQTFCIEDISEAEPCDDMTLEEIDSDLTALIVYTSGSTGMPKGVIISHANILAMTSFYKNFYNLNLTSDVMCLYADYSYIDSWSAFFNAVLNGIPCLLVPRNVVINFPLFATIIQKFKVTFFVGGFTILGELSKHPTPNFTLRFVCVTGEVYSKQLMQGFRKVYPNARVYNEYGLTETTATISVPKHDIFLYEKSNIIGRGILDSKLYIVDAKGCLVEDGIEGELWVSGPTVALGYVDKELDQQYFIKDPFDDYSKYKVLKTGDYVKMTEEGIEYVGRKDHILKIRGHKVNILEVERAINSLFPDFEVFVSTKVNPSTSLQELHAFYKPSKVSLREVRISVSESLPSYMIPKFISVKEFPKTTSGKIDRKRLWNNRILYKTEELNRLKEGGSQIDQIKYVTAKVLDISPDAFDPSQTFIQHGGDSQTIFTFLDELNKLGFPISFNDLIKQPPLSSLCEPKKEESKYQLTTETVKEEEFLIVSLSTLNHAELLFVSEKFHSEFVKRISFVAIDVERGDGDENYFTKTVADCFNKYPHLSLVAKVQDKIVGAFIAYPIADIPTMDCLPLHLVELFDFAEKDVIEDLHAQSHIVAESYAIYVDSDLPKELILNVFKALSDQMLVVLRENGFTAVTSVNVSPATKAIAKHVYNSVIKKSVYLHSFEVDGRFPYKEIDPGYHVDITVDYLTVK